MYGNAVYFGDAIHRNLNVHKAIAELPHGRGIPWAPILPFAEAGCWGSNQRLGGVRKVRWAPVGSGKSGGIRAIYYWKKSDHEIWMLTLYSKSERASIPGHTLKQIAEAIKNG
jgi:hypothetical protein